MLLLLCIVFLPQFASVPELVTFYQSVSLREYNRTLDTRLLYPVSRFASYPILLE